MLFSESPTSHTDKNDNCETWAKAEECVNNPTYMMLNCRRSCDLQCKVWAGVGKCELERSKMLKGGCMEACVADPRGSLINYSKAQYLNQVSFDGNW